MKTALVHDCLPALGGAEKVFEIIYEIFSSTVCTFIKNDEALKGSVFESAEIHTSFIQKIPSARTKYRKLLSFFSFAVKQFDLSNHEFAISSSCAAAKGVLASPNQIHICYCCSPMRCALDMCFEYLKDAKLDKGLKGLIAKIILLCIRIWDYSSDRRTERFAADSCNAAQRIRKFCGRKSAVIYPPADVDRFELCLNKEDCYLTASRLAPYKKFGLIAEAFNLPPDKKLIVCGSGPQLDIVKKKAFVSGANKDFGIAPGVTYAKGGSKETVIENKTGVYFYKQTPQSIISAIKQFENKSFDGQIIRNHALKFSKKRFLEQFNTSVKEKLSL